MFIVLLTRSEGIEDFRHIAKNDGNHIGAAIKNMLGEDIKYRASLVRDSYYVPTTGEHFDIVKVDEINLYK